MNFQQAVAATPQYGLTANGAKTQVTSGDEVLNFFFLAGASRGKDITSIFDSAFGANIDKAIRVSLWMRDCRGGAGERNAFRQVLQHLSNKKRDDILDKIIPLVPILGRWDDLLVLPINSVREFIHAALKDGNGLCAKWMPRQGTLAEQLRGDFTPKQWRKLVVGLSNTVEQLMCAQRWADIEFKKVPSLAAARYQSAFKKHCPHYEEYKKALVKGETKINASVIYPHDVIKAYNNGDKVVAQAQWDALPNYMPPNYGVMPICDVSGSMEGLPMEVSLALGIYCSDKLTGPFKDLVCTFSDKSQIYSLKGDLGAKLSILKRMDWGMNTNLQRAFSNILEIAKKGSVLNEDMPKAILIISDMEFDVASRGETNYKAIKDQYKQFGYDLPQLIFWNVNGRQGNLPVRMHKSGTCLISGFSPAILQAVFSGEEMTPMKIMDKAIMIDRYNWS